MGVKKENNMMKNNFSFLLLFIILMALGLSACGGKEDAISYASNTPLTWIDAPLDKSTIPYAPYEIVMHGTDANGITKFEISLDGSIVALLEPSEINGSLYSASITWQPVSEGVHQIQVRSNNRSGSWSNTAIAEVTIDGNFTYLTPPPEVEETPTPSLTSTPEATETLTLTPTATEVVCPVLPPVFLVEPVNGFNIYQNLQTGISWQSVATMDNCGATSTRFQIATDTSFSNMVLDQSELAINGSYSYITNFACGTYFWRILSYRGADQSTSEIRSINILCPSITTPTTFPANDTTNPTVYFSYEPSDPDAEHKVTFTTTASDNVGVSKIEIYLQIPKQDAQLKQTCNNTTSCTYSSYLAWGSYNAWAYGYDAAGNRTRSEIFNFTVREVIK